MKKVTPEEECQSIENIGAVICLFGFLWMGMAANVITLVAGGSICLAGVVVIFTAAPAVRLAKKMERRKCRGGRAYSRKARENAE